MLTETSLIKSNHFPVAPLEQPALKVSPKLLKFI